MRSNVIPYTYNSDCEKIFLLGLEISNNMWSGFSGNYEKNDYTIVNTALRHFNDETAKIFDVYYQYIYSSLLNTRPIIQSKLNKRIYLWIIKLPYNSILCTFRFHSVRSTSSEKVRLKWFTIDEINSSNNILDDTKKYLNGN